MTKCLFMLLLKVRQHTWSAKVTKDLNAIHSDSYPAHAGAPLSWRYVNYYFVSLSVLGPILFVYMTCTSLLL